MRGRDYPIERAKICNHKVVSKEICIVFQRIWVQSLIFVTNEQMRSPLIRSPSSSVGFRLESLVFRVEGTILVLVPFSWDLQMPSSR